MQRASYPHPNVQFMRGLGFGDLTAGVTGVKSGVQAGMLTSSIGAGTVSALGLGAAAGSVVPIVGTAIGVIVALVASGVFSHKMDPEVGNFNNAMALVRAQGPTAVLGIQDKYLVLAGLFDLEPGQVKGNIPIYKKYGRMGEQRFVMDMCALIQAASNQGIITANDTVQSVYDKVVAPWIAGFGFGPMQDSNTELINYLLLGLIGEYVSGQYKQRWYAVGGQFAFGALPAFTLPGGSGVTPTTSGTPVPTTAPTPVGAPAQPAPAGSTPQSAGFMPTGQTDPKYGPTYTRAGDPTLYAWYQGSPMAIGSMTAPPQAPAPTPVVAPAQLAAVAVPAGFVMVGQANNLPAYQGPDGFFYSWSGTTMSPLTGYLQSGPGQGFNVVNGQGASLGTPGQTALSPSLSTNTQAGVSPFASTAPAYVPYTPPSSPLPSVTTPIAAGIGAGLPSWLTWGAVAGVVGLMLITARPAGRQFKASRARRRQ
jgi:hypothetical protein